MTVEFEKDQDIPDELGECVDKVLRASREEAARVFGARDERPKWESLGAPQAERKDASFINMGQCIGSCLLTSWGRDRSNVPAGADFEQQESYRPFISGWRRGASRRMSWRNGRTSCRWNNRL